MGAILPPMQTEPARLFGTQGTCVVLRVILLSRPLSPRDSADGEPDGTGAATALAQRSRRRAEQAASTRRAGEGKGRREQTSSPMYHKTLLVADLRELPVPTTSPT